jgi:two-component system chemotaxis sensor kinase CheA
MSEHTSASSAAGIDLSQFHQVFFEEAGENLERMEQLLLDIDIESADDEELNAIFRCAHSVKGGAATFGFADVAELTHQMETLLDKLRRHELAPSAPMVDVLLQAGDALKAQLALHQGAGGEPPDTTELLARVRELAGAVQSAHAEHAPARKAPAAKASKPAKAANGPKTAKAKAGPAAAAAPAAAPGRRLLELTLGPVQDAQVVQSVVDLFAEIADMGRIEPLDGGLGADGLRRFKLSTECSDSELTDLFSFVIDSALVRLAPLGPGYGFHGGNPGAPPAVEEPVDHGFFDGAPGAPDSSAAASAPGAAGAPRAAARPATGSAESGTLRVSVDKVDQLINLVGELVITQAMLAQSCASLEPAAQLQLSSGLADLQRNTRNLQESVMSIRMIPMSAVFNRFPRMLRDLASKLGKKVELVTQGEATELDKGMIEKITDPLTHLVRNSCDHGIEMPADRVKRGKPETGTITLAASHRGGSIVIEVRDDGKGLSRGKLLATARERGLHAPDSLSDSEVFGLIFAPGFSTAEAVTDVSGRGVGMDVVKKNIAALGGVVEIDSAEGYGMSVRVRLPLTLAIMDSMSVRVADECYVLPLASVVESFQFAPHQLKTVGGRAQVIQVREEFLPVVELERVFDVRRPGGPRDDAVMVVIESDGVRIAALVDELLGQQQVVVKNLESNYGPVDNVSGATIMGDGRVALILDVGALVRRARH